MSKRRMRSGACAMLLACAMVFSGMGSMKSVRAAGDENGAGAASQTAKSAIHKLRIASEDNKVPRYQADEAQTWTLVVTNDTGKDLENLTIAPDLGEEARVWPFKTDYQKYEQQIDTLGAGEAKKVSFDFVQRDDVGTMRYAVLFSAYTEDSDEPIMTQKLYINTTAKPQEPASDSENVEASQDGEDWAPAVSEGSYSYSGGGSGSGNTSVPRVIVTGFSTDPGNVRAGSDFTLTIHLKNTSKKTRVQNMLFDLAAPSEGKDEQSVAPAFLPTSGSSTIYLDGIDADGEADIAISLNAKADLYQKPYSVELTMKYEDSEGMQIEGASGISIPVRQDARFEFSKFELSPDTVEVGSEANVMCNLYNLGRIKLYNVKAKFEGAGIETEEIFIGNVESGAAGSIDAMLEGKHPTNGRGKVTMTLTYEDESGRISEVKKEFALEVVEAVENEMPASGVEEKTSGFTIVPLLLLVLLAAVIAVVIFALKHRKKKQALNEEEGLLDELDRSSEDELK